MLRNGTAGAGRTTTTTTTNITDLNERGIRRLRLTLRPEDNPKTQNETAKTDEKLVNGTWKRKNGLMQRERPPGRESSEQEDKRPVSNGIINSQPGQQGPRVYGVVQSTSPNQQQEVMAREWSVNHLRDEMSYIREVRDSLEKVRERMYGQFGGMQQSMQKLSQELRVANAHKRHLESEVRTRSSAMDSFDQMNSSLISANIDLQKSLLENCQNRVGNLGEMKSLRSSLEKTEDKLRDTERKLAAAQAENRSLKNQVETSQEAKTQALKELSAKLQKEYEEQLREQQKKYVEEIEALQAQLDDYMRRLEEAEKNAKIAEAKIAERDQRIIEVERLLSCMAQEKGDLINKLYDCEQRLRGLDQVDHADKAVTKQSEQLKGEAAELKERIKHLNDMVFSQQRKVKTMIEEVETLRGQVAQKDMFITELLDRIAIVECENNELEDKLKYFMSIQRASETKVSTREIGVGCDLPIRSEEKPYVAPVQPSSFQSPPRVSRLTSSLLKYTPGQYTSMLRSSSINTQDSMTSTTQTTLESSSYVQTSYETESESIRSPSTPTSELSISPISPRVRTRSSQLNTPFMRLMEMTPDINID
nr:myocardial zonula adherens protein-like isoform X1 [Misgurnus anguillicaudatus]XP_055065824.1 myocardial zonula adherens protein-like isoform X1 [Misgurnus anguillicaudatus]XP_055065831.1 myocardial zonula adherens protein-like isoform X1 [Misgurnus anguillicaudatus]XP_055065840.1 myocardial zonula adherens protein-like isoform X1 [Misgurnus anguillicaudatus]XP_055065847.1 myocardial zonula adherens protein-like isoform X1 [Misgurnus anguillicaudatus]XP_055065857.1 myocardial zonula adheren